MIDSIIDCVADHVHEELSHLSALTISGSNVMYVMPNYTIVSWAIRIEFCSDHATITTVGFKIRYVYYCDPNFIDTMISVINWFYNKLEQR